MTFAVMTVTEEQRKLVINVFNQKASSKASTTRKILTDLLLPGDSNASGIVGKIGFQKEIKRQYGLSNPAWRDFLLGALDIFWKDRVDNPLSNYQKRVALLHLLAEAAYGKVVKQDIYDLVGLQQEERSLKYHQVHMAMTYFAERDRDNSIKEEVLKKILPIIGEEITTKSLVELAKVHYGPKHVLTSVTNLNMEITEEMWNELKIPFRNGAKEFFYHQLVDILFDRVNGKIDRNYALFSCMSDFYSYAKGMVPGDIVLELINITAGRTYDEMADQLFKMMGADKTPDEPDMGAGTQRE